MTTKIIIIKSRKTKNIISKSPAEILSPTFTVSPEKSRTRNEKDYPCTQLYHLSTLT